MDGELIRQFSDQFFSHVSSTKYVRAGGIFEVAKAMRTPLDELHFTVKTICDPFILGKTEHSGHFSPPIVQRLAQGAQRREGRFRS